VDRPAVDDLTVIEPVSKKMGERTHTEPNAATDLPITEGLPSRANAASVKILHEGSERAQFQITPEDQPDRFGFLGQDDELLILA
jgi:hypothetical protein